MPAYERWANLRYLVRKARSEFTLQSKHMGQAQGPCCKAGETVMSAGNSFFAKPKVLSTLFSSTPQ